MRSGRRPVTRTGLRFGESGRSCRRSGPQLVGDSPLKTRRSWASFLVVIVCGMGSFGTASAFGQDGGGTSADPSIPWPWYLAPICGVVALVMARKYYLEVLASDEGDEDMIRIAGYVREGAMAYLFRQYRVVGVVFVALMLVLANLAIDIAYTIVDPRIRLN